MRTVPEAALIGVFTESCKRLFLSPTPTNLCLINTEGENRNVRMDEYFQLQVAGEMTEASSIFGKYRNLFS